ncbi:sulfite exporter TauE/SafE family protein [bacterium]|nr:sulfite exporter TauE/SafE family protein [bacterium]
MTFLWYVLAGLSSGTLGAMLGVGGGIIMVPLLGLAFGFSQKSAQGMSLAVMVPMALVGAIRYKISGKIEMDMVAIAFLACGSIAGAFLGSHIVTIVSGSVLRKIFAVVMMIVAVKMYFGSDKPKAPREQPAEVVVSAPDAAAPAAQGAPPSP